MPWIQVLIVCKLGSHSPKEYNVQKIYHLTELSTHKTPLTFETIQILPHTSNKKNLFIPWWPKLQNNLIQIFMQYSNLNYEHLIAQEMYTDYTGTRWLTFLEMSLSFMWIYGMLAILSLLCCFLLLLQLDDIANGVSICLDTSYGTQDTYTSTVT